MTNFSTIHLPKVLLFSNVHTQKVSDLEYGGKIKVLLKHDIWIRFVYLVI